MTPPLTGSYAQIPESYSRIEEQIAAACRRAGRARSEVALIAVSKLHPAEAIAAAAGLGITLFGENRVQEFAAKLPELAALGVRLDGLGFHLIGQLQSNKSARAAELFAAIDTLDSARLAERVNDAATRLGKRLPVLIEIKLSPEESKSGFAPEGPELRDLLTRLPDLAALELRGLMTVPPFLDDPEAVRPYFAQLRGLRDRLAREYLRLSLPELSMGMSHDFAVAIEEGATQIRIGTALFGRRSPPPRA